jgi:hypothetical protein
MRVLAESYPELATFTPDATLMEIKVRYGLGSFHEVREMGRRRQEPRRAVTARSSSTDG